MAELYDDIGVGYRDRRRPDPRVAAAIVRALEGTDSVVNVGAGAGSYEPADRFVVAVEPAMTMIRQRRAGSAPVVQAVAADLPFRDDGFAAALAILTIHHWPDKARGLDELARVARRRVVVVTWDPSISGFWLADDYFPEIFETDRKIFPSIEDYRRALGHIDVRPMPIPPRLRRRLPGRVLAAAARLPRCRRSRRHLDLRQAAAARRRVGSRATSSRSRRRNVGAPLRPSPRPDGNRPRLPYRRRGEPLRRGR